MRRRIRRLFLAILILAVLSPSSAQEKGGATGSGGVMPAYRDLFVDLLHKSQPEVDAKIEKAWHSLFEGDAGTERVFYPVGDGTAYVKDIANNDVRTEGMSYGMMIAVQRNRQAEFDMLWRWARAHMYQSAGSWRGYYAWHCSDEGWKLAPNPASDGEQWFAMALFFAAGRWGRSGAIDYRAEAQTLLDTMLHSGDTHGFVTSMFNPANKQVVFVPGGFEASFTDPSYHLPAWYELWARWAARDNDFWSAAAAASRAFWQSAANPLTGLMPDYARVDGFATGGSGHDHFAFDAWRAAANAAVDWVWFAGDPWEVQECNRLLEFFAAQGIDSYGNQFTLDGKKLSSDHSTGLVAMNAVAAVAATSPQRTAFIQALWDADVPRGTYRYYDGLLYLMALLHVSGEFRIYAPGGGAAQ